MKIVFATTVLLIVLDGAVLVHAQDKPPASLARVRVSGTLTTFGVEAGAEGGGDKATSKTVTVFFIKLVDAVEVQVQTSRLIGGKELTDLIQGCLAKGAVADGTLKFEGKKLVLAGGIRARDDTGTDKEFVKGTAVVEGEALRGKYKYGKDEESVLAVKNGKDVIVLAGKLGNEQAGARGMIRVAGKLRADAKGTILINADKLNAIEK